MSSTKYLKATFRYGQLIYAQDAKGRIFSG